MKILCKRCHARSAVYTVVAPVCMNSMSTPLCPVCFQSGIDAKEIVWLGDTSYGICSECIEESA